MVIYYFSYISLRSFHEPEGSFWEPDRNESFFIQKHLHITKPSIKKKKNLCKNPGIPDINKKKLLAFIGSQ